MQIDEAIKRCEDVAEKQRSKAHMYDDMMVYNQTIKHNSEAEYYEELMNECYRWVEEYRQFAEWLRELKEYRDDCDYKTLKIKLENAEDIIRGLQEDLRDAREELRR